MILGKKRKKRFGWVNGFITAMNINGWSGAVKVLFSIILTVTAFFKLSSLDTVTLWAILLFNLPIVIDCSVLIPKLPECINEDFFKFIHIVTVVIMWMVIATIGVAFGLSGDKTNEVYQFIIRISKWFYFVNLIANILLLFYRVLFDRTVYKKYDY